MSFKNCSSNTKQKILDLAAHEPAFWEFLEDGNFRGVALTLDVMAARYEGLIRRAESMCAAEFEARRREIGVVS